MGLAYVRTINPLGEYVLMEIINIGLTPGVPPRPTPGPTPPNWSPIHPEHPIANPFPPYVDIGFPLPQPPFPGSGPGPMPTPGPGVNAIVIPVPPPPEGQPAPTPPAGMPPDSKQVLIWFGPGTQPATAWVAPYASTGPVTPPAAPAPAAKPNPNPRGM